MAAQSRSLNVRSAGISLTEKQEKLKAYKHQWYLDKTEGKCPRRPPRFETICATCGKPLSRQNYQRKEKSYCNFKCRDAAASKRRGEQANRWKGGRIKVLGYIQVRIQPEDPFYAMRCGKDRAYVFEHRLVMARHIGRCLFPWEIVHHKNGDKTDNRIENLQLLGSQGIHNTMIEKYIMKLERENAHLLQRIALLEKMNEVTP